MAGIEIENNDKRIRNRNLVVVECVLERSAFKATLKILIGNILSLHQQCEIRLVLISQETVFSAEGIFVVARKGAMAFLLKPVNCSRKDLMDFFAEGGDAEMDCREPNFVLLKDAAA